MRICDPACGSGHFLVAAAHRIAKRLAAVRSGDEEPSPGATRTALRDVIGHCIHGVDMNEMAVELCKVSLWMEALEPGKPLSFLDHRIVWGNSLLGTTPALIAGGIPDDAFKPIEGDNKAVVSALRKQNKQERTGQMTMFAQLSADTASAYGGLARTVADLDAIADDSIAAIHQKEERYRRLTGSEDYHRAKLVADAWCAAFVWRKERNAPEAVTHDLFLRMQRDPPSVPASVRAEIERLARQYGFLHWHLAFPEVFGEANRGGEANGEQRTANGSPAPPLAIRQSPFAASPGFDVVLGNPPWERIKLQEQEWFAARRPEIAAAPNAAARKRLIDALASDDPDLHAAFLDARRGAEGESHFVRSSGRYPLCGRGDINTYAIFAETKRTMISPAGRVGAIVPLGIATDDTTKLFFQDLISTRSVVALYGFENESLIFPGVHHATRFCVLTLSGAGRAQDAAEFAFFARSVDDLRDDNRRFTLTADDIALLNPNTRTCPVFRTRRDAEITKAIYRRVPVLVKEAANGEQREIAIGEQRMANGPPHHSPLAIRHSLPSNPPPHHSPLADRQSLPCNPWGVSFLAMLHMANDSGIFRTREQLEADGFTLVGNTFVKESHSPIAIRYSPLYEAKMIHHFDHRFGDYRDQPVGSQNTSLPDIPAERLADPDYSVLPRYWVQAAEVDERLRDRWDRGWLLGWRDITGSEKARTVIASVVPRVGVGHTTPLFIFPETTAPAAGLFQANLATFVLDFAARQKVGGTHLTYHYLNQLPVLAPSSYEDLAPWDPSRQLSDWLLQRVLELTFTAHDLTPFARDLGYDGPPFRWDEERRFLIRAEIDAAFFHLYGIARDDADYILDTFPIVKRRDQARFGEYRTKRVILECYDLMQRAIETGKPYETILDPPPGDPRVAHAAGSYPRLEEGERETRG